MTVEDRSPHPPRLAEAASMFLFGFVSTYQPTLCGLATSGASLYAKLVTSSSSHGRVVRVVDSPQPRISRGVVEELVAGDPASVVRAAAALASCDVVIVQHEYCVYGGADGEEILSFLSTLTAPKVVVLHTPLSEPTPHQKVVLERVAALADVVVVMTGTARDRLSRIYDVDLRNVRLIPHGAPVHPPSISATSRWVEPSILTWGLIGPGKGIEWGIAAMAHLQDVDPVPQYVVAGQTCPKVLAREGETYRLALTHRVNELRLTHCVTRGATWIFEPRATPACGDGTLGARPDDIARLRQLTEDLSGTFHTVVGDDVATAVLDFASSVNGTQVVVGASRRGRVSMALHQSHADLSGMDEDLDGRLVVVDQGVEAVFDESV